MQPDAICICTSLANNILTELHWLISNWITFTVTQCAISTEFIDFSTFHLKTTNWIQTNLLIRQPSDDRFLLLRNHDDDNECVVCVNRLKLSLMGMNYSETKFKLTNHAESSIYYKHWACVSMPSSQLCWILQKNKRNKSAHDDTCPTSPSNGPNCTHPRC